MKLSFSGVSSVSAQVWASRDEMGVAARRVDDHEVGRADRRLQRRLAAARARRPRPRGDRSGSRSAPRACSGIGRSMPLLRRIGRAVLDVAAERALPRIEIERRDARAIAHQRDGDVQRRRRLARAALLVADDQDMAAALDPRRLRLGDARIGRRLESARSRRPCGSRRRCRGTPRRRWASRDRPRSAALMPMPVSKLRLGQMPSTTTTPFCWPARGLGIDDGLAALVADLQRARPRRVPWRRNRRDSSSPSAAPRASASSASR